MTQTVQARCPHCEMVLRIPSEWLNKSMRCKHCKKTFQAKSSATVPVAAPAPKAKPAAIPVAQPANATAPSVAVGASPASSGDPFGFDQDETTSSDSAPPKRRGKGRGLLVLVLMFFFLFILGASGAGFVVYKALTTAPAREKLAKADGNQRENPPANPKGSTDNAPTDRPIGKDKSVVKKDKDQPPPNDEAKKDKKKFVPPPRDKAKKDGPKDLAKKDGAKPNPKFTNDPFPRRALLISVNNYLMFNTVQYGGDQDMTANKDRYPGSSTAVMRDRLTRPPMNFPATQVTELSDGIPPENKPGKAHSTQKSVLASAITDFVESAREQDRILVLFAGHGAFVEDKSYLVPIDGNLQKPESLVPLQWVYDQLAKCKAQQKVLILDVFRFSPSRGFERPSPSSETDGAMPEGFDKDVLNPPPGVQVWCSCQKEQSSIELERGSAFLQALSYALQGGADRKGISNPTQAIPVEALVKDVNERLKTLVAAEKRTQVSRLTGKVSETSLYNKEEPLAASMTLKAPTAAGGEAAPYDKVNTILAELREVPPTRETRTDRILLDARNLPAFPAKKIDGYKQDGYQNLPELEKRFNASRDDYAKDFPLRAAYFEALEALKESSKVKMREVLGKTDTTPDKKKAFLDEQQPLGISIFKLEQSLGQMKEAAEKRESETSKRWQANFDYAQARLQARLVYLYEYNYTLGQIRNDNLPELTAGQNGWRVGVTGQKINVTEKKAKDYAKDTKKIWQRIQDEYPDTPWSLLAQRESMTSLGLQWRPKSD
jgi:hypothetical protein